MFFIACNKEWMEAKVDQSQSVPKTLNDYRLLLNNYTTFSYAPSLTEFSSDYTYITEANWSSVKNGNYGNAYTWSSNVPYTSVADWNGLYSAILSANIILEGLDKLSGKEDPNQINLLKGEALFYRGKFFYELATTFSPPYDPSNLDEPYGIPLRIISDVETPTNRSTVRQTYDQIISDLLAALQLLPAQSNQLTHPTKVAVLGLLSRMYLAISNYDESFQYADEYLTLKNTLLDYTMITTPAPYIGINVEIGYFDLLYNGFGLAYDFYINKELYEKYDDNDLRKTIFFTPALDHYSFTGSYGSSQTDVYAGVATDEVLLTRAECLARKGNINAALMDLNNLLRTRYRKINENTTYVDYYTSNPEEALSKILAEREKQLVLRNTRWADLRRLNRDPKFAKTFTRIIDGKTYTLEPNSYKYTFPIPKDVIDLTGIQQNKGW